MPLADTDIATVARRSAHADRYTVIALGIRPGVQRFFMTLEYGYFPPGSPLNDEFQYVLYEWADLPWTILIVPLTARETVRRVAGETGMRLADGVPTLGYVGKSVVMGTVRKVRDFPRVCPLPLDRVIRFPVDHARAFTLENDHGSPVYVKSGDEFIRAEERRWIQEFWAKRGGNPLD